MAKLGDLVVRIGADTRDLNKSLGKVQRNMRSMTSNFTALGTQMTKAITLPILGVKKGAKITPKDLAVFPWEKAAQKNKPQLDGRRMLESLVKYSK